MRCLVIQLANLPVPARHFELEERREASAPRDEILRRAGLDDAAVIDDHDASRFPGGRKAVSDGQYRRAAIEYGASQRVPQCRVAGDLAPWKASKPSRKQR